MITDTQLLEDHLQHPRGAAFTELVNRHLNLVYSAALRQVNGDVHLARDVTQLVFTDLAKKATTLRGRSSLTGWLFVSTRFIAANRVRSERRRQTREREAHLMSENESATLAEAETGPTSPASGLFRSLLVQRPENKGQADYVVPPQAPVGCAGTVWK